MSAADGIHPPSSPPTRLDEATWAHATSLDDFIAGEIRSADLWRTTARLARVEPADTAEVERALVAAGATAERPARLVALLEDWCGDAMFTVPFAHRLADASPAIALRVLGRDANPALMNTHLTGLSRSIPVIMLFDPDGIERGWWGPRPLALQRWMLDEGLAMEKPVRYKAVRTWYARDRGRTTVRELLALLARLAQPYRVTPR